MKKYSSFYLFFLLGLFSCNLVQKKIRGNGNIKVENRSVSSFSGVDVRGHFDVYLSQDSVHSVRLETDENLAEFIEVYSEDETLVIRSKDRYKLSGSKEIKVFVSAPVFKKLNSSGACDIFGESIINSPDPISIAMSGASNLKLEVNVPKVSTSLSGAASVELKGRTRDFSINGSGSIALHSVDLLAENVEVDISGSGDADVFASVSLDVSVTGAGDVRYKGSPSIKQHISGAGSLTKIN